MIKKIKKLLGSDFKSEYCHGNKIEIVDGRQFFRFDCSGFVYWCLAKIGFNRALVELRSFLGQNNFIKINRFFCKDFAVIYRNADKFKYWRFVLSPIQNCILIVVFPGGNGHCMFVDKVISQDENNFYLRVLDSTRYPHENDTRKGDETGIGTGNIKISHSGGAYIYDALNSGLYARKANIYFVLPIK